MKPVSNIREGLALIPGALNELPPALGYEGSEEAVRSYRTRTIWTGEKPSPLPQDSAIFEAELFEDEADDDVFSMDGGDSWLDPVFEIGAEMDERFPGLGGAAGRQLQQSVRLHGMDALAWYVSFHHPGLQWGIYIPISGLAYMMQNAFGNLLVPVETKAHLAFHAALNHELFHFATDYAIAQAELDHHEPWYIPGRMGFLFGNPSYCIEEEQMANAYMLSAFRSMKPALRVKGKQAALRAFVGKQPVGYCDALSVRSSDWDRLLVDLARRYGSYTAKSSSHPSLWNPRLGYDWPTRFPIRPRIDWRYCPIHLVDDSARFGLPPGWLSFFSRLSAIEETDDFRRKLEKLTTPLQRAWERTKQKLAIAITAGADFKKWDKGGTDLFSVRVNDNFRAHLQRRRDTVGWLAVAIGNHKEMGHG
jgi:hypothetical protein